jgi:O-antigen/teichoic acid export membrane protein
VSGFFLDNMLPILTNLMARLGPDAVRTAYRQGARLNQVIGTGCSLVLLCLGDVALSTFGVGYKEYWLVLLILVLCTGIVSNLGILNAHLLTGLGKVDRLLGCQAIQVAAFLIAFSVLKRKSSLLMLAIAQGIGMIIGLISTMVGTREFLPFRLRVPREFVATVIVLIGASSFAIWAHPMHLGLSLFLLFACLISLFLLGGYRWAEILAIVSLFRIPFMRGRDSKPEKFILSTHKLTATAAQKEIG